METVESRALFTIIASGFAKCLIQFGYLNCWRRKKIVLSSYRCRFISGGHFRGSHRHIHQLFLVHFQEAGTRGSKLHRTGRKHNISVKGERILFFLKTKSHINDVDPWLNNVWKRKNYFILVAVTTGGWNSGHLPNHLELLYDWQATISYCTLQL